MKRIYSVIPIVAVFLGMLSGIIWLEWREREASQASRDGVETVSDDRPIIDTLHLTPIPWEDGQ